MLVNRRSTANESSAIGLGVGFVLSNHHTEVRPGFPERVRFAIDELDRPRF